MKTSNKIILLTIVFLFGMLVFYNLGLKASYDRGEYKNVFADYTKLNYKNFDKVLIKTSHEFNVEIRRSDTFDVRASNYVKDQIKVGQSGRQLQLEFDSDKDFIWRKTGVVISLPVLEEVTTASSSSSEPEDRPGGNWTNFVEIKGFDQSDLIISQIEKSEIQLKNNKIRRLRASLSGKQLTTHLLVDGSNKIDSSYITVKGMNTLSLTDIYIPGKYSFSDSAVLNLTGGALKMLRK